MLSAAKSQRREERDDEEREQHEAPRLVPPAARPRGLPDEERGRDGHRDADRQRPRLAQHELAQRAEHYATARDSAGRRGAAESARTAPCETPSHTASTTSRPASPSGQCTPMPSAQKNVPNVVSTSPTTYLSSLS